MPINIRMKPGFMYLGENSENLTQEVPMPNGGNFSTNYNWQAQNSADGSIVGQQLGTARSVQVMSWSVMDCQTWWNLNEWIESNGMSFYARYFNFNRGVWQTRRFYVTTVSCTPFRPGSKGSATEGQPLYLKSCTFTVNDMGEVATE